ncbi:glycosyltransferase family 2 protein [Pseudomonas sp. Leaf127]|uniref:glycosyltransferase family 2 protein n=1 Tax=Pseudomonas sp. Leaf127 TaxID=1736267 RepID=UPI000AB6BE82|nr:glycosyltransferase [Pseudomonas sp. Leaf127]
MKPSKTITTNKAIPTSAVSTPVAKPKNVVTSPPVVINNIQKKPESIIPVNGGTEILIKVDEAFIKNGEMTVIAWSTHTQLNFCIASPDEAIPCETLLVERPDVLALIGKSQPVKGYVIKTKVTTEQSVKPLFLTFNISGTVYVSPITLDCKIENLELVDSKKSKAHIDFCGAITKKFGVLAGWCIAKPGVITWLMDSKGNKKDISQCLRFHRDDITRIFSDEYASHTIYSGFVTNWPYPQDPEDLLAIVEEDKGVFKKITLNRWTPISNDPVSYAKYAFQVPTPAQDFNYRLDSWEGEAISTLIEERNAAHRLSEIDPVVWKFGVQKKEDIKYSIIIPLYGRWDFIEHQLNEFSKDRAFYENVEIVYVFDDPALITPVVNEAENLLKLYGIPFTFVWGHRNRGFSGANNLGVKYSHGEYLILLNSDVFPTHTGWVEQLCNALEANQDYGIIGAKLLFPDGGLQHGGMEFVYSQSWSVWLNKHPLAGLDPNIDSSKDLMEKPAVTGACMAISRATYIKIDGFDEGYLIGDFEDSDLCMKIHAEGLRIGYLPSVVLTHLERQSFTLLGDTSFRTLVVRYNAWRHSKKWGNDIKNLMTDIEAK